MVGKIYLTKYFQNLVSKYKLNEKLSNFIPHKMKTQNGELIDRRGY